MRPEHPVKPKVPRMDTAELREADDIGNDRRDTIPAKAGLLRLVEISRSFNVVCCFMEDDDILQD